MTTLRQSAALKCSSGHSALVRAAGPCRHRKQVLCPPSAIEQGGENAPSTSGRSLSASPQRHSRRQPVAAAAASVSALYGPKALHTRGNRSLLELEAFGPETDMSRNDMKRLTARVRAARRWAEIKSAAEAAIVYQQSHKQPLGDSTFISAVFAHLPKVVLTGTSALGEDEQRELDALLESLVDKQIRPMLAAGVLGPQGLLNVAVGLAKLEYKVAQSKDQVPSTKHHQIPVLDRHPQQQPLFEVLAQASTPYIKAGAFNSQSLSMLLWAMATVGSRPSGSWLSLFWNELGEGLELLASTDVANIFWSICRLDIMPPWHASSGSLLPGILPHALKVVPRSGSGQDASTMLVCLAIWHRRYSYRPSDEEMSMLLSGIQPHLRSFLPSDLVSCVHSLVVMNVSPSRIWMTDFYVVLQGRLIFDPALSCSDFQRLLWALSRIDFTPSQSWLRHFVEISRAKLRHLRYRALSELLWAMSCWGYAPTQEWMQEYFRVTFVKLPDYKPHHLANSIMALKRMNCKVPTPWLDAALRSFCSQLDETKAHDLVTFLDGCVDVCEDAAWMNLPGTGRRLRELADFAASKFAICDCLMHAKLLMALATARCHPGGQWLLLQQETMARTLAGEGRGALDADTAAQLRTAYAAWEVPLSPALAQELDLKSQ